MNRRKCFFTGTSSSHFPPHSLCFPVDIEENCFIFSMWPWLLNCPKNDLKIVSQGCLDDSDNPGIFSLSESIWVLEGGKKATNPPF